MSARYTPGPWRADGKIVKAKSYTWFEVAVVDGEESSEETLANARIMACAPELLSGLKAALHDLCAGFCTVDAHGDMEHVPECLRLGAVVAKAEGGGA